MNAFHENIFAYVKGRLEKSGGEASSIGFFPFRVRSDHIKRVYMWAERLSEGMPGINKDALLTAAAFHDSGYGFDESAPHAVNSARVFMEYSEAKNYDVNRREFIQTLILRHSDKALLKSADTPLELVILMEADLLDESGAMSIVWDCLIEGAKDKQSFEAAYSHIKKYTGRILGENPMVTEAAKAYWCEKQRVTRDFINALAFDIGIDEAV